jgi:hypothetical protein
LIPTIPPAILKLAMNRQSINQMLDKVLQDGILNDGRLRSELAQKVLTNLAFLLERDDAGGAITE